MKKLRILIADVHGLVRRDARKNLRRPGWSVVAEEVSATGTLEKARALKPDVALLDIGMPEVDGIEVARQIRETVPHSKVVMLAARESEHMIRWALEAGARGYLLKSDLTDCLGDAVNAVSEGRRFLSPRVWEIVLEGFLRARDQHEQAAPAARLSPRETEIVRLLALGRTNRQVAAQLGIAVRTVEAHRAKIMLKLDLHSPAELTHYAIRHEIAR